MPDVEQSHEKDRVEAPQGKGALEGAPSRADDALRATLAEVVDFTMTGARSI
jgi:hypothetical protein